MELKEIEERINRIEERNKRVELDKSWETSWTRKVCIMILTYIYQRGADRTARRFGAVRKRQ